MKKRALNLLLKIKAKRDDSGEKERDGKNNANIVIFYNKHSCTYNVNDLFISALYVYILFLCVHFVCVFIITNSLKIF